MAEVKLLKDVGANKKGTVLDIKDKTVLAKWQELGVIESPKKDEEPKTEQELGVIESPKKDKEPKTEK